MQSKHIEYKSMIESQLSFETYFTDLDESIKFEEFEEEQTEEAAYSPQHPALVFHADLQALTEPDHLENYVEVQPFESKE